MNSSNQVSQNNHHHHRGSNSLQWGDQYTLNANKTESGCSRYRPCYREITCRYCWYRKNRFIVDQYLYFETVWGWNYFLTISIKDFRGNAGEALQLLSAQRRFLFPRLFGKNKFVSLIVVEKRGAEIGLPHFHIIVSKEITTQRVGTVINRMPERLRADLKFDVMIKSIKQTYSDHRHLLGYLMQRNLRRSQRTRHILALDALKFGARLKQMRLITASRGFYTGRPKRLLHVEQWRQSRWLGDC